MQPSDFNLPAKFSSFRPAQIDALEQIDKTAKRFILLQAPTGSGKTLIAATAQRMLNTRVVYTCSTKQLEDQVVDDFSTDLHGNRWAIELKGRANYYCLRYKAKFPTINTSLCTKKREKHCRWCCDGTCNSDPEGSCLARHSCPYERQKAAALSSSLAVLNTALLLTESNFVGRFSDWPLCVIDEACLLENEVMNFVQLEITRKWIDRLRIEPPKLKTVQEAWFEWARDIALPAVRRELVSLSTEYGVEDLRRQEQLERMEKKLEFFLNEVANPAKKWVFMPENDKWLFKPVFVSDYMQHYVWRHAARFMLMSATILSTDEMARSLGIPKEAICFIDLPSTFSPNRRPVYYIPAANMTHKTKGDEFFKLAAAVDDILEKHPQHKTLIHTVSYENASKLMSLSKYKSRMMTYTGAMDRADTLDKFKASKNGTVLVASSMERGIDLPQSFCRIIIILKVPFLSLGNKQVAARLYSDKKHGNLWYAVAAIRTLIQMSGRAMRSAEDWSICYVLDSQFERLYSTYKYLFPLWWRSALHLPKKEVMK